MGVWPVLLFREALRTTRRPQSQREPVISAAGTAGHRRSSTVLVIPRIPYNIFIKKRRVEIKTCHRTGTEEIWRHHICYPWRYGSISHSLLSFMQTSNMYCNLMIKLCIVKTTSWSWSRWHSKRRRERQNDIETEEQKIWSIWLIFRTHQSTSCWRRQCSIFEEDCFRFVGTKLPTEESEKGKTCILPNNGDLSLPGIAETWCCWKLPIKSLT